MLTGEKHLVLSSDLSGKGNGLKGLWSVEKMHVSQIFRGFITKHGLSVTSNQIYHVLLFLNYAILYTYLFFTRNDWHLAARPTHKVDT